MKQICRMAVIGEDSRFESFLMALFSNFAKAIGKDMVPFYLYGSYMQILAALPTTV